MEDCNHSRGQDVLLQRGHQGNLLEHAAGDAYDGCNNSAVSPARAVTQSGQEPRPPAPAPARLQRRNSTAHIRQVAAVAPVPEDQLWKEAVAPDGKVYYFHTITKQTSWVKPGAPGLRPSYSCAN